MRVRSYSSSISSGGGGGGSVNSVTASSPLASSGGTNPNISLTAPIPVLYGGFGEDMTVQSVSGTSNLTVPSGNVVLTSNNANVVGITAGTFDGQLTYIYNGASGGNAFLITQSGAASAANRIALTGSIANVAFAPGQIAVLRYDTSISRWRVISVGFFGVANTPLSFGSGVLSISQSSSSASGYLSQGDWIAFDAKVGIQGTFDLHSIPYVANASGPSSLTGNVNKINFNSTKVALGVGLPYADLAATIHSKSDTAQTVDDPISFTATLVLFTLPTNPTIALSAANPDIQQVTATGTPSNLGGGAYSPGDVVDVIITPGYSDGSTIIWGVASRSVSGITDVTAFDIDFAITQGTENLPTNVWSFSRQVNGGGYNDYQRFTSTTFTDTTTGWVSGADPDLGNKADDFLANGANPQVTGYGTKQTPISTTIYSSSFDTQVYNDPNDGTAYKLHVAFTGGTAPYAGDWPGSRQYSSSVDFTTGPTGAPTSSGALNPTPTTYGYLSNGSALNIQFDLADKLLVGSNNIYSVTPITVTVTDPNDGQRYYVQLAGNTGAFLGKLVKNTTTSLEVTPAGSFTYYDDGVQTFPGNGTLTPTGYYLPGHITETHGTTTNEIPSIIHKALDGSGRIYHQWLDSVGSEMGYLKVDGTNMTFHGTNSFNLSGQQFNMTATNTYGALNYNSSLRLKWDNTGLGFFGTTPAAQPTTAIGSASFTANSGTAINDASTFDGYTIKQIVKALRDLGVLQ